MPQDVVLTEESNLGYQLDRQSVSQTEQPYKETTMQSTLSPATNSPVIMLTEATTPTIMPDPTITYTSFPSPSPTQLPTETSLPTELPTATDIPQPGVITGHILLHGAQLPQPVTLILEDQEYRIIQEITFSNGEYRFENLPASSEGYNILFAQDRNPQFAVGEVVSWAWIGPIPVQDGDMFLLPNIEIGLLGLRPVNPPDGALLNAGSITPQNPLIFEWDPFPSASHYWVDLRIGPSLQLVWQSEYVNNQTVSFDGILMNGETIQPNSYWWSVGARIDEALITISAPLTSFTLKP